jgi:hypothetical protein
VNWIVPTADDAPDFVAEPLPVVSVERIDLVNDARRLRREIMLAPTADDESACPIPARRPRSIPSADGAAYWTGFTIQLEDGIQAKAPAEWPLMRQSAFRLGQADGLLERPRREREEERAEDARVDRQYAERMEDAFGEPGSGWPDSERIQAIGCIEARQA